jgi:hypothetical protein
LTNHVALWSHIFVLNTYLFTILMQQFFHFINKPILKLSLIFGVITALLAFSYFLVLYFLKIQPLSKNIRVPDFGLYIIMMATATWYYRQRVGKGLLHLWEALTICYVVNSMGALLTGWLIYGFVTLIDPSLFSTYLAESQQLLVSDKANLVKTIGAAEYQKMFNAVAHNTPAVLISDEFGKKSLMAVLPIVIISLLLRRQDYGVNQPNKSK